MLAGGASSRFGAPKGLAMLSGRTLVARVISSLRAVGLPVVLIANDPAVADQWDPSMPDREPGCGPLSGITTALGYAAGEGMNGALCVACDMPLVSPATLRSLAEGRLPSAVAYPGGKPGVPACFPAAMLPKLAGLGGEEGAALLLRGRRDVRLVECDPEELRDVDWPEDLPEIARLLN